VGRSNFLDRLRQFGDTLTRTKHRPHGLARGLPGERDKGRIMKTRTQLVAGILAPLLVVAAEQTALSSWSDSEKERFLQTAKVVKTKDLSIGVTGTQRLTLSDGVSTHDAHFQNIDVSQMKFESPRGSEMNFRDSYKYNIAGYRLDRMLDLRMAPVSVERKIGGRTGAMTWWVDDVQMMESERLKKKIKAPDLDKWNDQMHQVNLFTELIYNTDQNMTNLLITNDWTL